MIPVSSLMDFRHFSESSKRILVDKNPHAATATLRFKLLAQAQISGDLV